MDIPIGIGIGTTLAIVVAIVAYKFWKNNLQPQAQKTSTATPTTTPATTPSSSKKVRYVNWFWILALLAIVVIGFWIGRSLNPTPKTSSMVAICPADTTIVVSSSWSGPMEMPSYCGRDSWPKDSVGYWIKFSSGDSTEIRVDYPTRESRHPGESFSFRSRSDSLTARIGVRFFTRSERP